MIDSKLRLEKFAKGTVWLVGTGPGDPGLITLYALYAIQKADVIIYDALVNPEILKLSRKGAKIIFAGKRGGKPSFRQEDISNKIAGYAKKRLRVLRLKSGDPFVFGRGAEEALKLVKENIPFRIVPGITAGIGGMAYAGIPATYRNNNHSITLITGHKSLGKTSKSINWKALAKGTEMLVFYMVLGNLEYISKTLINAGRKKNESVALISSATTHKQRTLITTLEKCPHLSKKHNLKTPTMLIVGINVNLRKKLKWEK
jgi:uroporphyrin-III C-methyltransferase